MVVTTPFRSRTTYPRIFGRLPKTYSKGSTADGPRDVYRFGENEIVIDHVFAYNGTHWQQIVEEQP